MEQTGTESDCSNGQQTNYAWYELYPAGTVVIDMAVNPKDSFTGTVTYIGSSKFTLTLTDNTSKGSFTTTQTQQRAQRNSVEWIVEAPSNRPLADFGQIPFTSTSATISGTTRSVATASPITMVNNKGVVRAAPPLLNGNPGVTWYHQ